MILCLDEACHLAGVAHRVVHGRKHIDAFHAEREDADEDWGSFDFGVVNVSAGCDAVADDGESIGDQTDAGGHDDENAKGSEIGDVFETLEAYQEEEDRHKRCGDDRVLRAYVLAVATDKRVERTRDVGVVSVWRHKLITEKPCVS